MDKKPNLHYDQLFALRRVYKGAAEDRFSGQDFTLLGESPEIDPNAVERLHSIWGPNLKLYRSEGLFWLSRKSTRNCSDGGQVLFKDNVALVLLDLHVVVSPMRDIFFFHCFHYLNVPELLHHP